MTSESFCDSGTVFHAVSVSETFMNTFAAPLMDPQSCRAVSAPRIREKSQNSVLYRFLVDFHRFASILRYYTREHHENIAKMWRNIKTIYF